MMKEDHSSGARSHSIICNLDRPAGFTNAYSSGGLMANTAIKEMTASELNELLSHKGVVLANFSTTWCPPCRAMAPIVERLAARFAGRADVVKIDVDRADELASAHGVRGIPTFLLFSDGQVVERVVGTTSETALAALIESQLAPAREPASHYFNDTLPAFLRS
jgi:thioredoxin 1